MTLRHQVSLILPFGKPVGPDHKICDFRRSGFASPSFGGFAFVGSLAALTQFSFRPMALRHRVCPVLLFLGAILLLHFLFLFSITQMFYENTGLLARIQKRGLNGHAPAQCGIGVFNPHFYGVQNISTLLGISLADVRDRSLESQARQGIGYQ